MVKKGKERATGGPIDSRFANLGTDPRFLKAKRKQAKVVVDDRFKGLFTDGSTSTARVDKYGRKVGKDKGAEELKRFYRLEDQEGEEGEGGRPGFIDYARGEALLESSSEEDEDEEASSDDEDDAEEVTFGPSARHRRGSSELSVDLDEDDVPKVALEGDEAAEVAPENETKRLAIVNLDWDHVRAIDLYKVFSSLLSPDAPATLPPRIIDPKTAKGKRAPARIARGRVVAVHIYPSEFGKSRMERENKEGPPREIFKPRADEMTDEEDEMEIDERAIIKEDEGVEYDERALRKYQLERLRYYYAVAEFDTKEAARHVFDEIDGTEFERTANTFELRSVPDDMVFGDEAKDSATSDVIDYQAVDFVTDALRHSKVKLTWDADDPQRSKLTRRNNAKLNDDELNNLDVSAYLASDSSASEHGSDSDAGPSRREKLRRALGLTEEAPKKGGKRKGEMEITFAPAFENKTEEDETTLNVYQRKEKERRAKKKAERAAKQAAPAADDFDESDASSVAEPFTGFGDAVQDEDAGEVGGDADGFDDPFFASDSDVEAAALQAHDKPEKEKKASKSERRATKAVEAETSQRQRAELELLVDSDSDDGAASKHFDMKAILKAEKEQSRVQKGKRKRKRRGAKGAEEVNDAFEVNVADDRFKALHDDHRFAIDPSNPHYLKTHNTEKLLQESRRRRNTAQPAQAPVPQDGLANLVATVKRKSEAREDGKGKRQKR